MPVRVLPDFDVNGDWPIFFWFYKLFRISSLLAVDVVIWRDFYRYWTNALYDPDAFLKL